MNLRLLPRIVRRQLLVVRIYRKRGTQGQDTKMVRVWIRKRLLKVLRNPGPGRSRIQPPEQYRIDTFRPLSWARVSDTEVSTPLLFLKLFVKLCLFQVTDGLLRVV